MSEQRVRDHWIAETGADTWLGTAASGYLLCDRGEREGKEVCVGGSMGDGMSWDGMGGGGRRGRGNSLVN